MQDILLNVGCGLNVERSIMSFPKHSEQGSQHGE